MIELMDYQKNFILAKNFALRKSYEALKLVCLELGIFRRRIWLQVTIDTIEFLNALQIIFLQKHFARGRGTAGKRRNLRTINI